MTGQERILMALAMQKPREFTPKIALVPKTYDLQTSYKSKICKHHTSQMLIADIIPTGYANSLLQKTVELCIHEDNKSQLLPLASQYEHPDKDTIPYIF